jgi:hypothetical protein
MPDLKAQDYYSDEREDDPGIKAGDRLLRHCRTPFQIVPDAVHGHRLSSQAFINKRGEAGTSVDLEELLKEDGLPSDHRFGLLPNTLALVAVTAADARTHAHGAAWTPKLEDPDAIGAAKAANPWHGEIIGPIARSASRQLAANSQMVRLELPD